MIRRVIALAFLMGLTACCTPRVYAALDKLAKEPETAPDPREAPHPLGLDKSAKEPESVESLPPGDGITFTTTDWGAAGDIVDCVSRTIVKASPRLHVVPAKNLPQSVHRWNTLYIADLRRLLQEPAAKEEVDAARVRYVVMIGTYRVSTTWSDSFTSLVCCSGPGASGLPGPYATHYPGQSSTDFAKVWDVASNNEVARARATASGAAGLTSSNFDPATETAACEALGRKLAHDGPKRGG